MHCPFCFEHETKVIDSRLIGDGHQVRRRRECISCKERFTSFESAELVMPKITKSDGRREPFNEEKLLSGLGKALEKRPVSSDQIESTIQIIKSQLRLKGEREIPSATVGQIVMEQLKNLDQVAYIRFASVYLSFDSIHEFAQMIDKLGNELAIKTEAHSMH